MPGSADSPSRANDPRRLDQQDAAAPGHRWRHESFYFHQPASENDLPLAGPAESSFALVLSHITHFAAASASPNWPGLSTGPRQRYGSGHRSRAGARTYRVPALDP